MYGTRGRTSRAPKIIKTIPMPNFIEIPLVGFLGGQWLFWKDYVEFKFSILRTHEKFIHCHIKDNKNDILAGEFYLWLSQHLEV